MEQIVISNPVPTPEEMAEIIGMSPERVVEIRRIMDAPPKQTAAQRKRATTGLPARKSNGPRGVAAAKRKR
jgi:hypothetical protein